MAHSSEGCEDEALKKQEQHVQRKPHVPPPVDAPNTRTHLPTQYHPSVDGNHARDETTPPRRTSAKRTYLQIDCAK
eukprot:1177131-Prorocentrum_minimum.AAC.4